jgi:DNA ligase (NAD+)
MGIPLIGTTAAQSLTNEFKTWDKFIKSIEDKFDFNCLFGFGPEMSQALYKFDYTEMKDIASLFDFKELEEKNEEKIYEGLTFCVTGKLTKWKNRDELKGYIADRGGKVTDSVSVKTDYLINNDINSTSAKNKKAKELNIPILTEEDFLKL